MQKFFLKPYTVIILLAVGAGTGISLETFPLQKIAAAIGMTGLVLGMTKQAIMQYQNGKCGVHWVLNTLMLSAVILRCIYFLRTSQYWLAVPDAYGIVIMSVIQLQLAGYLLKKQ